MDTFKIEERGRAIQRGLDFICLIADNRKNFRAFGPYFISCFLMIASTSRDLRLRRMARTKGRNLAFQWRKLHAALPRNADANIVSGHVIAGCAAEYFGLRHKILKQRVRRAAKRFPAEILGFDPANEPPPNDLPETCSCGQDNVRGRKTCQKCKKRLKMYDRYQLWTEALCVTYWAQRYGTMLGARYVDVLKWLPNMRPYPGPKNANYMEFFYIVYAVTHLVYTLNGYGLYNLSSRWLPAEFSFLKASMKTAIDRQDADMVGELLDTLKSFGLNGSNSTIRRGINYLLSQQNSDGSWGNPNGEDLFERYHATWAAIDGLRDYAWHGVRLSFPRLQPLLEQLATSR